MRVYLFEDPGVFYQHLNHQGSSGKPLRQGKKEETSFLVSRRHFGHYKAELGWHILSPMSKPFFATLIVKQGIVLDRWSQGLSIMLEKIFGCILIVGVYRVMKSGNGIPFWIVSETKFCFGVTRKGISVSWCFVMHTYSRTMVEVETRSLSKRSHYIIISLCCSLKNITVL
jgi:hypothetical protein